MKYQTARQIYDSCAKPGDFQPYFEILKAYGLKGQLATYLLLAQRQQDKLHEALNREIQDTAYQRLMRSRNNFSIERLVKFCIANQASLNITYRPYKYGIRIYLRGEAYIRFRNKNDEWTGDAANLQPICDYCDRLVTFDGRDDTTGQVFAWPAAE